MKKVVACLTILFLLLTTGLCETTERRGLAEYLETYITRAQEIYGYGGLDYSQGQFYMPASPFAEGYMVSSSGGLLYVAGPDLSVEWVTVDLLDMKNDASANSELFYNCAAAISALEYTVAEDAVMSLQAQYGLGSDGGAALTALKIFTGTISPIAQEYIKQGKTGELLAYSGNYDYYITSNTVSMSDGPHQILYIFARARDE